MLAQGYVPMRQAASLPRVTCPRCESSESHVVRKELHADGAVTWHLACASCKRRHKASQQAAEGTEDEEVPSWVIDDLETMQISERPSDVDGPKRVLVCLPHGGSWIYDDDATAKERLASRYPELSPYLVDVVFHCFRQIVRQSIRKRSRGPSWVTSW